MESPSEVWLGAAAPADVPFIALVEGQVESIAGAAPFEGQIRFESAAELRRWGGDLIATGAGEPPAIEMLPDGAAAVFRVLDGGGVSERTYELRHLLTGQNDKPDSVTLSTDLLSLRALVRIGDESGQSPGSSRTTLFRMLGIDGQTIVDLAASPSGDLLLALSGHGEAIAAEAAHPGEWAEISLTYRAAGIDGGDLSVSMNGETIAALACPAHGVPESIRSFSIGAASPEGSGPTEALCRWIRWSHREEPAPTYDADLLLANLRDVSSTEAMLVVVQNPAAFGWTGVEAWVEHAQAPWPGDGHPSIVSTPPITLAPEEGFAGALRMTDLAPGAQHAYRVALRDSGGGTIRRSAVRSFRTLPDAPSTIRFGWMSCHEQSAQSHPFDVYSVLESRGADFIVNLGDFHYNDSQPALPYPSNRAEIMDSFRDVLLDLPYAAAARSIPMFIMLDDHDVWSNNATSAWADSDEPLPLHGGVTRSFLWHEGLAAWEFYFRRAMLNTGAPTETYRSWETGRTLFILLDTRSYQRRGGGTMLGLEQRDWLLALIASTDKENLVLCSPSVWGDVQDFRDNWEGGGVHTAFHAERALIEQAIQDSAVQRAIILSGDRHCSLIHTRLSAPKLLFEACAGPASNNVFTQYNPDDAALPGVVFCTTDGAMFPPFVSPPEYARMTGLVEIDEASGRITVEILDGETGATLGAYTPGETVLPSGDLNGDGYVDFHDLNIVLGAWGQQGDAIPADANGDGSVDFADLNIVLSAYNGA